MASRACRPILLFDLLQSRRRRTCRAYDAARTRALLDELASAIGPAAVATTICAEEIARANARARGGQTTGGASPRRAARRGSGSLAVARRILAARAGALRGARGEAAATRSPTRPPLAGPRVLLAGAPVDGPALHAAIESHGAVVVAKSARGEAAQPETTCACDDDPFAALADKYRARCDRCAHAGRRAARAGSSACSTTSTPSSCRCRPDDAVFGWDYPALRDLLAGARHSARLSARRSVSSR